MYSDDDIDDDGGHVYDSARHSSHAHATRTTSAAATAKAAAADGGVCTVQTFVAAFASATRKHSARQHSDNDDEDDDDEASAAALVAQHTPQLCNALLQMAQAHDVYTSDELLLFVMSNEAYVLRTLTHNVAAYVARDAWANTTRRFVTRLLCALAQHQLQSAGAAASSCAYSDVNGRGVHDAAHTLAGSVASLFMHEQAQQSATTWCTTGCVALDHVLSGGGVSSNSDKSSSCSSSRSDVAGGFRVGWVTEVYGEAGSGKTQLVLQTLLQPIAHRLVADVLAHALQAEVRATQMAADTATSALQALQQRCLRALHAHSRPRVCLYLVAEEVPSARLAALAAGALRRARAYYLLPPSSSSSSSPSLSSLLTQLPASLLQMLLRRVDAALSPLTVLEHLHVKTVASLYELCALLRRGSGAVHAALHVWGGNSDGIVVVDSIAAVVARTQTLCTPLLQQTSSSSSHMRSCGGGSSSSSVAAANDENDDYDNYIRRGGDADADEAGTSGGGSGSGSGNNNNDEDDRISRHVTALLAEASVLLRQLAVEQRACVLVVNQVRAVPRERGVVAVTRTTRAKRPRDVLLLQQQQQQQHNNNNNDDYGGDEDGSCCHSLRRSEVVAALGTTWAVTPHARVLLRRLPGLGRQLVLLGAPAVPPAQHSFVITADGIDDDGAVADA